jgi:glycosyltransferase involved in cell wall biosynthesis
MNYPNPTFSFIIPTLNEEKTLEAMILSVRRLNIFSYEIIVSDGGSTDGTLTIARRLADKVVENTSGKRQNIAIGRNAGARVAVGEYFAFMDADVFIHDMDAFFTKALCYLKKHAECSGYVVYLQVLPELRTLADSFFHGMYNRWLYIMNNIFKSPLSQGEFQLVPARFFKQSGGYNEKIISSEDMELFMKLSKLGSIHIDPTLTAFHTGRRAHKIGWIKMLSMWIINGIMVKFFDRSVSKEWTVIR